MRGREAAPTATRPAVSSLCGPLAPGTPAPLDTEIGDTLGFTVGSTPFLPQKKNGLFVQHHVLNVGKEQLQLMLHSWQHHETAVIQTLKSAAD